MATKISSATKATKATKARKAKVEGIRKVLYFSAEHHDLAKRVDAYCKSHKTSFAAIAIQGLTRIVG